MTVGIPYWKRISSSAARSKICVHISVGSSDGMTKQRSKDVILQTVFNDVGVCSSVAQWLLNRAPLSIGQLVRNNSDAIVPFRLP